MPNTSILNIARLAAESNQMNQNSIQNGQLGGIFAKFVTVAPALAQVAEAILN